MISEDQLREELRAVPLPAELTPRDGMADTALTRSAHGRRARMLAVAAFAVVAVGLPWSLLGNDALGGRSVGVGSPSEPKFPTPGGGTSVVRVYVTDVLRTETRDGEESQVQETVSWVLDPDTGEYTAVPYPVTLSPDGTRAAVSDGDRLGVADRAALLRDGEPAIRWTKVAGLGPPPVWSPDGTAVLVTSIEKGASSVSFTAHRYDVATGAVTDTPVRVSIIGSSVGWAADSRRYVAWLRGTETADTVKPGALQYLNPDGTLGPRVDVSGGDVGGAESYSPSRRLLAADATEVMAATPARSPVVDVRTGRVVATLSPDLSPVGWRDDDHVVVLNRDRSVLSVVVVKTGAVAEQVKVASVPGLVGVQVGPSTGLTGPAARNGF